MLTRPYSGVSKVIRDMEVKATKTCLAAPLLRSQGYVRYGHLPNYKNREHRSAVAHQRCACSGPKCEDGIPEKA